MYRVSAILIGMLLMTSRALAHVPVFSNGSENSPETAIVIDDPTVSRVVYGELTPSTPQIWATFQGRGGETIPFRLGVPMIDRLESFRPALAVFGPGLPPVDVPFAPPDGLGGVVVSASPDAAPEAFHEEFTGTDSWIIGDLNLTLPADGQYYVVAYSPSNQTGKLWFALGDREVFGPDDIANFGQIVNEVRAFHEIAPSPVPCFVPLLGAMSLVGTVLWFQHRRRSSRVVNAS